MHCGSEAAIIGTGRWALAPHVDALRVEAKWRARLLGKLIRAGRRFSGAADARRRCAAR